jgi:hypothetical protein
MSDKDLMSKTMPKSPDAFHEWDRVWKAKVFYECAKEQAEKRGIELNWHYRTVPNADHNNPRHAQYGSKYAAASKKNLPRPGTSKSSN